MALPAQMAGRPVLSDEQPGFAGGLNTIGDALELQQNQMSRADNVRLTTIGSAAKRGGTQRIHASAVGSGNPVQGGFCWRKATSVEHIVVSNGVFYSGGATYAIPMTYTAKAMSGGGAAISSTAIMAFAAFRDGSNEVLYLADGGTLLIKWDGTTLSRIASTPSGLTRLAVYNQRLHGVTGVDQTDWWSAVNNGDTIGISGSAGGSAVVRTFGNQRLTNVETIVGTLALSHVTGVSRFTGITQDDIAIAAGAQGWSSDVGSPMPSSWVVADGVGYFLSERGAYQITDAGISPLDTPQKPDPTVPIVAALQSSDFLAVSAVHDRRSHEIRWSIPSVGAYVYNYRLQAWTSYSGGYTTQPARVQWDAVDANGEQIILFGDDDGFVRVADAPALYLDDVLSDGTGGSPVVLTVTCHRMFTDEPESFKSLRWAYVFADLKSSVQASLGWSTPSGSTGNYTIPNTNQGATWGVPNWGAFQWGATGATRYRVPISGRGPYVDFTLTDSSASQAIFSRLSMQAFDMGPRG